MPPKLLIIFDEKVYPATLKVAGWIASKLGAEIETYCIDCTKETLRSLEGNLEEEGLPVKVKVSEDDPLEVVEREKPYLVVVPKPRVNPITHAFKKPWSEKLAMELEDTNILLVEEETDRIEKVLLYVDRDKSSDSYIRSAYEFLTRLGVEFKFTTIFDERYYELLIKKEHPEMEAKEILGRMFEDYVNAVREKIKKALNLEKVEILPLKGEERKTLPYFVKLHGYDMLVISHAAEDKDEIIENSETSLAIFKN